MPNLTKSIVLEGPNGSGKSYLANQLAEKYMVPVIHSIRPESFFDAIDKSVRQHMWVAPVILDRSHAISRLVYQHEMIGLMERELLEVCAKYLSFDTTVIYCTGIGIRDVDKPHYNETLIKETKDQEPIIKRYNTVMSWIRHQKYNFAINDISDLHLT